MRPSPDPHYRHRFPAEIIGHAVWLYHVFSLSLRDVELLSAERGIAVSYETVRRWGRKFAATFVNRVKRWRPRPGDRWHMDEVFIRIQGVQRYLWRAVDWHSSIEVHEPRGPAYGLPCLPITHSRPPAGVCTPAGATRPPRGASPGWRYRERPRRRHQRVGSEPVRLNAWLAKGFQHSVHNSNAAMQHYHWRAKTPCSGPGCTAPRIPADLDG